MKKVLILIILFAINYLTASDLTFTINNPEISLQSTDKGVRVLQENSYYSGNKNDPAIPILSHYFEIPEFTKIESVKIRENSSKVIPLNQGLLNQPEQVIMSMKENYNSIEQVYSGPNFPQEWLYNYGSSMAGSKNIAFLAIYSSAYDQTSKTISKPANFTIDISLSSSPSAKKMPDSSITRQVHKQLALSTSRLDQEERLVIIYPAQYETAFLPLIAHREKQGLDVITATTEYIYSNFEGIDNAEKIRNYLINEYNTNGLDYVTLGADINHIPERRLWAFDCNYGLNDENHIPGDIYYANLNGDWNENQNTLYGEDDDNVDYFPELVVSRLPAMYNISEVEAMITKIISYEEGYHQDYSQGLGLSQNLWDESNSVYVQEYMEEMYYPDFINNIILNEDENNVTSAQENFNRNPNIVQHTGHCFWHVIALGDGTINESFVNNMENDYAGMMYSIGCWAAALDFDAIAEKLVRVPEHGLTAFVGNSRYGWGAPTADGFGFSEFYQKEFARLLFQEEITNIAMLNQLQKIPFVAYQTGTSVFKWCSYQLNTIGDSYYHLFIDEPKEFNVDYYSQGDNYSLYVSYNQEPLQDVVITLDNNTQIHTDINGQASFMAEPGGFISLYKSAFKMQEVLLETTYESTITQIQVNDVITPSTERVISFKIRNAFDIDLVWELRVKENDTILGQTSGTLTADQESDWLEVSIDQPTANILNLELYSTSTNEVLDNKYICVDLAKPEIAMTDFSLETYPLVYAIDDIPFSFTLRNISDRTLDITGVEFLSDNLWISQILPMRTTLEAGQEESFEAFMSLAQDVNFASLDIQVNLTNEYWTSLQENFNHYFSVGQQSLYDEFENQSTWFVEDSWQRTQDQAYNGDHSLTCYPDEYGSYDLDLPLLTYTDDINLSFMYKYKMPMYGQDGFSIYVITDQIQERIIFLGSGGALNNQDRDPEDFIFSDWAEYSLNLGDILLEKPEIGQEFTLRFSFSYFEDSSVTNNYNQDPELGVFLDNMLLSHNDQNVSNEPDIEPLDNHISVYPNPLRNSQLSLKHNSKIGDKYQIYVYNLKGQRVYSHNGTVNSSDKDAIQIPIFQRNKDNLSSGIYFVKYKTVDSSVMKKILFLK